MSAEARNGRSERRNYPAGRPLLVAVVTIASCVSADDGHTPITVYDSAGVRIVESTARRLATDMSIPLDDERVISIGAVDGNQLYLFDAPQHVILRNDGGVVVADRSQQIRFFGAHGRHQGTIGGKGEGPGEFGSIGAVFITASDSLLVYDGRLARLTVLAPNGRAGYTRAREHLSRPLDLLADSTMLSIQYGPSVDRAMGIVRFPVYIVRESVHGEYSDTVWHDIVASNVAFPFRGRTMLRLPFAGSIHAVALGDGVVVGDGSRTEVRLLDSDGRTTAVYRWHGRRLPVTKDLRAEYLREQAKIADGLPGGQELRPHIERLPFPDSLPAFDKMIGDPLKGRIWLRVYDVDAELDRWTVIDRDGSWLVDLVFPSRFQVMDVLGGMVAGVWRDPLDVAYVRVYSVAGI